MNILNNKFLSIAVVLITSLFIQNVIAQTTALWLFDESQNLYPSHVLDDSSENDYPMALGLNGKIVSGKYGNALEINETLQLELPEGPERFGLTELPIPEEKKSHPLSWKTATYGAIMTSGELHLRKEIGMVNATDTKLNIGAFDWTIEFWFQTLTTTPEDRYFFELGNGKLGEDNQVTALYLNNKGDFVLKNGSNENLISLKTNTNLINDGKWHHLSFVYDYATKTLRHFINGKKLTNVKDININSLPSNEISYMVLGTNGSMKHQLKGRLDELKFSSIKKYVKKYALPESNSEVFKKGYVSPKLVKGLPLLFDTEKNETLKLGTRKHLFIDDAFIASKSDEIKLVVNPPAKMERVIDNIKGSFRKHITVVEDQEGLIRIYNGSVDDYMAVYTSEDGVNFKAPDLDTLEYMGNRNITLKTDNGALGNPFIDPNGPDSERWKYFSDYNRRGIYMYTSPDGYQWTRKKTSVVPFRSGTQSCTFYDDQRQRYVSYHRSGIFSLPEEQNQRSSVLTEHTDFNISVSYPYISQKEYLRIADSIPLRSPLPWFLDNGPLTPGGFGMEFPHHFDPIPEDPSETDIYITKAQKYEYAPDTYLAFPVVYFHYEGAQNKARRILETEKYQRGSGPLETQLSSSRDGLHWKRYPRPAYVGIGNHLGRDVKTAYIAHGMVKRESEIWQYYFGETQYHSALKKDDSGRAVYRLVQRLDGFVSMDSPYDKEVEMVTKPFTFSGNRLELNIDTDATGYAQVGVLDENDNPIEGFSLDDCVYINGDFINSEVEWMDKGADVSSLQGITIKLVFKMRGSKLYGMQFTNKGPE